ncbi:Locomotion-related protein Hikaru genki [Gryllus bimaculatus]|nr:Locomotion-related protein Hikaru genki [Gryllus bimaculatus]
MFVCECALKILTMTDGNTIILRVAVIISVFQLSTGVDSEGAVAKYTCDDGYELFGGSQRTCSQTGTWQGELPFCGTNIAFRKPANQSTSVRGGAAGNGNDGEFTTVHEGQRCTETQKETSPWWSVDLLQPYTVGVVRVTTRGCCGHQPLKDIEIRVGNSSTDLQRNPLCAWFPGTIEEGVTKTFSCARPLVGQFVFLQLVGVDGSLSVCEVEVFTTDEFSNARCAPSGTSEDAQISAFSRTCYEFPGGRGGSYAEARAHCQRHGGDLVHGLASGDAAAAFLVAELERRKMHLKTQLVWIGATRDPGFTSRTWRWVDGEVVAKPSWGKDQPNNYNGEQNCVVLDGGRNWLWNDVGCNLDYLHWICQHTPPTCGSPDKLLNTTFIGSNYSIGSVITYKCPVGHTLVGNNFRTCDKNGFWTGGAPSCKYIDCGPLNEISHGIVRIEDNRTTFGAGVSYTCHENYTLVGHEKRTCEENGLWSGEEPQCLYDWCPAPPEIHGGYINISGQRAGSTATYNCQSGFILFGESVISCSLGGEWSGKAPVCKFVDCGAPAHIDNGQYILLNETTTYGSLVVYSCHEDYWLDGTEKQMCSREGKWSANTPSCVLITCDEPDVPPGGYVVGYDFNVHSTINYHCEAGYLLRGEPALECTVHGEWSGEPPTCEFIDCGKLPPMPYEIRCPEPVLAEHSILSVTGNDRVYGRTLIKTAVSAVSVATYKIGSLVKYRCERGYKVVGDPLSTCEETGQWSDVDCGSPGSPLHGKYSLASNATFYGVVVLYECEKNYELDGHGRRLCLENGTWSSETPQCREIQCSEPEKEPGMIVHVTTYSIGGVAQYSCQKGQYLTGSATRTCQKGGWTGQIPTCKYVDCKHPGSIENGRSTTYNSAVEYHCIKDFERIGLYLRKCLENGSWSGEEPRCEIITAEEAVSSNLGLTIGIAAGVVLFLLIILGVIYLRLRKPTPVKNTENIEGALRKEDQNAAVMSYATLNGSGSYGMPNHPNLYDNVNDSENMYDAPYEVAGPLSHHYEPSPMGRDLSGPMVTINGVAVR